MTARRFISHGEHLLQHIIQPSSAHDGETTETTVTTDADGNSTTTTTHVHTTTHEETTEVSTEGCFFVHLKKIKINILYSNIQFIGVGSIEQVSMICLLAKFHKFSY